MAANVLLLLAAVAAGWAVLSVIGGERQRRLDQLEAHRRTATAPVEKPAAETARKTTNPPKLAR